MVKIRYAAYGSNLHPMRFSARIPSAKLLGKALLKNKALRFHKISKDGSGKCNIIDDDKRHIFAAIYELHSDEKPILDSIEGVGQGYRTEEFKLDEFGSCFTYIAQESHIDDSLNPYTWYKELVLVGCMNLKFPSYYVEEIYDVDANVDLDSQRHSVHMELVRRAKNLCNV